MTLLQTTKRDIEEQQEELTQEKVVAQKGIEDLEKKVENLTKFVEAITNICAMQSSNK